MTKLSVNEKEFQFEQRYRPKSIAECILPEADKKVFEAIVKKGRIPSMILHSASPGTGKTTVARALCEDVGVEYMFVNGADCKIDFIRGELTRFASALSLDPEQRAKGKVIIIDEYDRAGLADAQMYLRSFSEAYSQNCTFILTANNLEGIIPALRSRFDPIQFGSATKEDEVRMMKEMIVRSKAILDHEGVPVTEMRVLAALVKQNFPDFRKTIKQLDKYSKHGKIDEGILSLVTANSSDVSEVVEALKSKQFPVIRSLAPRYANTYAQFIVKLYNELYNQVQGASVLRMTEIIGENNQTFAHAADKEIHITFLLMQLMVELEFK